MEQYFELMNYEKNIPAILYIHSLTFFRVCANNLFMHWLVDYLTFEDGTDRFPWNVDNLTTDVSWITSQKRGDFIYTVAKSLKSHIVTNVLDIS